MSEIKKQQKEQDWATASPRKNPSPRTAIPPTGTAAP